MVFAGEHLLLGRRAAIKTLLPSLSAQPQIVERFFNEARATSAIADPGIVQLFDFGYHVDGTPYIVMELLEGESLISRIERLKTLPLVSALRIARQVASSLAAAHERDIVHRDLKPENIFLIGDREAQGGERTKVLDFGICKIREGTDGELAVFGTPVYMSPEQCRGAGFVDHRTDIYALGCVLFEMLTGRAPFERETAEELVAAHQSEVPPMASAMVDGIPPAVDAVLQRCLAKSPDDRYPSMTALGEAIEEVLARWNAPAAAAASDSRDTPPRPVAVALGGGFRSGFDGSADASSADAVTASLRPPSAPAPRRSARRNVAIGLALLAAAAAASVVTRFAGGESAIPAATAAGNTGEPAAPPGAPAVTPPPAPPVQAMGATAAEPEPRTPEAPPPLSPYAAEPRAAEPSPPKSPSSPRRPVRGSRSSAHAPGSAFAPAEDLYDTR